MAGIWSKVTKNEKGSRIKQVFSVMKTNIAHEYEILIGNTEKVMNACWFCFCKELYVLIMLLKNNLCTAKIKTF